jgi:Tol biopolymer transport system component
VARADGSRQETIVPVNRHPLAPAWSPDGSKIAFEGTASHTLASIFTVHPDGTQLLPLTSGEDFGAWSPDGTKVAFTRRRHGADGVWIVDAASSQAVAAGRAEGNEFVFAWLDFS